VNPRARHLGGSSKTSLVIAERGGVLRFTRRLRRGRNPCTTSARYRNTRDDTSRRGGRHADARRIGGVLDRVAAVGASRALGFKGCAGKLVAFFMIRVPAGVAARTARAGAGQATRAAAGGVRPKLPQPRRSQAGLLRRRDSSPFEGLLPNARLMPRLCRATPAMFGNVAMDRGNSPCKTRGIGLADNPSRAFVKLRSLVQVQSVA